MLSFVQNWFAPRANPIGVDFGSDCLRLAQVQFTGSEYRLIAAASADVPAVVRHNVQARMAFFVETTRDLLAQGNFQTRQAVLAMPASAMHVQHLRMAKLDEAETKKALPWEARGKLPIDPSQALMRHLIAGEVYQDQEPRNEVIVMAAPRDFVNQLLASAAKARLDVIGMNVEPKAIVDCFSHIYRRKAGAETTNCYLDIGLCASRAIIARGSQVYFARTIPIGGEHFNKATAHALRISLDEAKLMRIQLCHAQPPAAENPKKAPAQKASATASVQQPDPSALQSEFPLLGAGLQANAMTHRQPAQAAASEPPPLPSSAVPAPATVPMDPISQEMARQATIVEQACAEPLGTLIQELDLCRRYFESTFPNKPVDRLIFIGGEARQRSLCQHIARELGLAAEVGDPMVRMGRISDVGIESGIDRRHPQPGWTVAIGLSLGPARGEASEGASAPAKAATGAS
jgi:type IV pilus assembly protein PilM